jgi:hypothetical protein
MFGLRGRTFVTGSGDWGVGCKPDFHNCRVFVADFPSSRCPFHLLLLSPRVVADSDLRMQCSPHIVSTGATFYNGSTGRENGIAFSSGGFSWCPSSPFPSHVTVWSCLVG